MLHQWRDTGLVCVHNLAPAACRARLKLGGGRGSRLAGLLDHEPSSAGPRGVHQLELEPYAYRWYRVGDPDDALERSLAG